MGKHRAGYFKAYLKGWLARPGNREKRREQNRIVQSRRRIFYLAKSLNVPVTLVIFALKRANGRCEICGNSRARLCVDHDHESGRVRGVLCHSCNSALGLFKDSLSFLKNAIGYLER